MFAKIHSTGGHSFMGCMGYLLNGQDLPEEGRNHDDQHDPRVAWAMTGNLGTKDPATAARVMAATAMNADTLKAKAGVSRRGRPTTEGSVMHYTLSWREDEIEGLTEADMKAAALESLAKLGKDTSKGKRVPKDGGRKQFADEHQFVLVSHNDRKHPHVHVMVNMTHPDHGRRLPTSNDQNKLQTWARKYQERHNNQHLCPAREANHKARRLNEKTKKYKNFVKAEPDLNRKDYELQKDIPNSPTKKAVQNKLKKMAAKIGKGARDQELRHKTEWDQLGKQHKARVKAIHKASDKKFRTERRAIVKASRDKLDFIESQRDADTREFKINEESFFGKLKNSWEAIKAKGWDQLESSADRQKMSVVVRSMFRLNADPKARLAAIQERSIKEEKSLHREVDRDIAAAKKNALHDRDAKISESRKTLQQEREDLIRKHRGEDAKVKAEWRQFSQNRRNAFQSLRGKEKSPPGRDPKQPTKATELLPSKGSQQAAKQIDQHKLKQAEALKNQRHPAKKVDRDEGQER